MKLVTKNYRRLDLAHWAIVYQSLVCKIKFRLLYLASKSILSVLNLIWYWFLWILHSIYSGAESWAGFLSIATADIWIQIMLCHGGYPMYCRMLGAPRPLSMRCPWSHPIMKILKASKHCQIFLRVGGWKLCLVRTSDLENKLYEGRNEFRFIHCVPSI